MRNKIDDQIDFYELIVELWQHKLRIASFMFVALVIGLIFSYNQKVHFSSKIIYSVEALPPNVSDRAVLSKFKENFYSEALFKDWQKAQKNSSIVFNTINNKKMDAGFPVRRDDSELSAQFKEDTLSNKKRITYIQINSNDSTLINDFYEYTQYVNNFLTLEYLLKAKEEFNFFRSRFNSLGLNINKNASKPLDENTDMDTYTNFFETENDRTVFVNLGSLSTDYMTLNRYIVASEKGENLFFVNFPSNRISDSRPTEKILIIALLMGGFIGTFFSLLHISILRNRKNKASK